MRVFLSIYLFLYTMYIKQRQFKVLIFKKIIFDLMKWHKNEIQLFNVYLRKLSQNKGLISSTVLVLINISHKSV